ncbi:MAG: VanZ family protein [Saprospiraceae bacterium]|nr:VanZ family protein [Saprospiraceae bacterium]
MILLQKPGHYRKLGYLLVMSIIVLSLSPSSSLPQFSWDRMFGIDKIFHFFFHGLASFCFLKSAEENAAFKIALAMFLFGFLIECLQKFLPGGRFFDVADLVANLTGILAAILLFKYSFQKFSGE